MLSPLEITNFRQLLISSSNNDLNLAIQLLEGFIVKGFPFELIPDLLVIFHQSKNKAIREELSSLLSKLHDPKLMERLKRLEKDEAFEYNRERLTAKGLRRDIAKYTDNPTQIMSFAQMLYAKYQKGLPFLLAKLSSKEVIVLLRQRLEGGGKLNLSKLGLNYIPREICAFPQLEELDISRNRINNIPRFIAVFKKLKVLKIDHCDLKHIHRNIGKLQELEELDVSYNLLVKIPEEFGQLRSLKKLRMLCCSYSYYGESLAMPASIQQLKNIEYIDSGHSSNGSIRFSNYPRFSKFSRTAPCINLEPLQFSRDLYANKKEGLSYLLKYAPIAERQLLFEQYYKPVEQKWDIANITLYYIPPMISNYAIKSIDFSNCQLGSAPEVGAGQKEEYKKQLDQVFKPLCQCEDLEELILRNNSLSIFPETILELSQLKYLNFAGNYIATLPEKFSQLRKLESVVLVASLVYNKSIEVLLDLPALKKITLTQSYFKNKKDQEILAEFKEKFATYELIFE